MATAHMNVKGRTSLDGSGWAAGLRKMEVGTKGAAARMAGSMSSMIGGVFAVGFLTSATRRIVQHADQIDKTAKRINASTDTVQKFDFAATQSGASLTDVEKAFLNTSKAIEGAKQGLTTQMRAFEAFGITMQLLKNSTPEQIFLKIAESIEKAGGALDKAKSLQDIMGRGGSALIPAFTGGFAGLMGDAPETIDAEIITKLADFNDELDRLKRVVLPGAAAAVGIMADEFMRFSQGSQAPTRKTGSNPKGAWAGFDGSGSVSPVVQQNSSLFEGIMAMLGVTWGDTYVSTQQDKDLRALANQGAAFKNGLPVRDDMNMDRGIFLGSNIGSNIGSMIGPQMPQAAATAAAAGSGGFMRPSLALNSLQRIGAAVSQSADPIAVEKDNNRLLSKIANNTKDIKQNTE